LRKRPLLLGACVFVTGLLFARYGKWYFPALAAVLLLYALAGLIRSEKRMRMFLRSLWLVGAFLLAIFHMSGELLFREQERSQIQAGETILFCATLDKKEYKNGQYVYYLKDITALVQSREVSCNRAISYLDADDFSVGETLLLNGKVNMFSSASNEGQFDLKSFYESQKIDFYLTNVEVLQSAGNKNSIGERLYRFKQKLAGVYEACLDYAKEGVLSVMLLGEKAGLDSSIRELYQSTGISHILAISGLHVSMIGMGLYRFLRKRGSGFLGSFLAATPVIFLYAIMTGNSVSTQRAVGMLVFAMLAAVFGRTYDPLNALGGMVLILLWQNPFWLWYSGFQLSVCAIFGVTLVGKFLQVEEEKAVEGGVPVKLRGSGSAGAVAQGLSVVGTKCSLHGAAGTQAAGTVASQAVTHGTEANLGRESERAMQRRGAAAVSAGSTPAKPGISRSARSKARRGGRVTKLWNKLYMAAAIWMTSLPLVAYYYYEVPTYAVLLNMLILPLLPVLFFFGLVGGLVGCVWLSAAKILLYPCNIILSIYDFLATACLNLPLSRIIVGSPSIARMLFVYFVLAAAVIVWRKGRHGHFRRWIGIAVVLLVFFWPQQKEFEVDVLDVGQGDGIYLCSENGVSMFIDGGSSNISSVGTYRILPYLKSKGITHITYWFVSHADSDHISGLKEVIESGYRIDYLVVAKAAVSDASAASGTARIIDVADVSGKAGTIDIATVSGTAGAVELSDMDALVALARSYQIQILTIQENDTFIFDGDTLTCLYPAADIKSEDKNDLSLVLLYENENFSALFTGDISSEVEQKLLNNEAIFALGTGENAGASETGFSEAGLSEAGLSEVGPSEAGSSEAGSSEAGLSENGFSEGGIDFYKAAHHGSRYSNSAEFLEALTPKIAAISCSSTNNYGHPSTEAVSHMEAVGAEVYYTMKSGQIKVTLEEGEVHVAGYEQIKASQ
jgi:competence protein ComEC